MKMVKYVLATAVFVVPGIAASAETEEFEAHGHGFKYCGTNTPCSDAKDAACMEAKQEIRNTLPPGCRTVGSGSCECAEKDHREPTHHVTCRSTMLVQCRK